MGKYFPLWPMLLQRSTQPPHLYPLLLNIYTNSRLPPQVTIVTTTPRRSSTLSVLRPTNSGSAPVSLASPRHHHLRRPRALRPW